MKILFTLKNFPPSNFGGIALAMFPIIKEISKQPNTYVNVLTTDYKINKSKLPKLDSWTIFNEIRVIYFKLDNILSYYKYLLEGFRQVKKTDYVFLNSIFFFPNFFFLLLSLIFKKKTYILPHGELLKPALQIKYWKKNLYLHLIKFFVKNVKLIATSKQESLSIQKIFPNSHVLIIPIFFDISENLNIKKINQFMFLGRIAKIKKIENIILACSYSKYFISENYKLLIVGPTDKESVSYKTKLEYMVKSDKLDSNITFVDEVASPEKEKLFSQSKSLFIVSDSENFSRVVVESLAQGTPVVASRGTPWSILLDFNAGFWIDNSPEIIAEQMDKLILMSDKKYNEMSNNSLTLSYEFSKKKILPLWLELFK